MTTSPFDHSTHRHASDGVLLALHDAQRGDELDVSRRHVEQCHDCQERLAAIAARASRVRVSLSSIPVPPVAQDEFRRRVAAARARHIVPVWRRPAWQTAAAVLVLTGAAAASPVRQWIRRRLEHPRAEVRSAPPPSAAPTTQSIDRSGTTVSFAATGPDFTIRFDSLPDTGVLTADRTKAAQISARVASGAGTGGDALIVLPGELRVPNTTSSRASYHVLLPESVARLRVIVAGRTVFDGAPPTVLHLGRLR